MARYITVSIVTGPPLVAAEDAPEKAVMKAHALWQDRLECVWPDQPDLVVLPEYCDRPLGSLHPIEAWRQESIDDWLEVRGNSTLNLFKKQAKSHRAHIVFPSLRRATCGRLFNSTQIIDGTGAVVGIYDKTHCTEGELKRGVVPGRGPQVFDTQVGRLAPLICFDLNFDGHVKDVRRMRPDILIFSSAYHGGLMQPYWAYSTRSWFVGSVSPPSDSQVLSPVGDVRATTVNYRSHVTTQINLDYRVIHIDENEQQFRRIKERYGPAVQIFDPGLLGAVLLTSESPDVTVDQVMEEFNLIDLDDYLRP